MPLLPYRPGEHGHCTLCPLRMVDIGTYQERSINMCNGACFDTTVCIHGVRRSKPCADCDRIMKSYERINKRVLRPYR